MQIRCWVGLVELRHRLPDGQGGPHRSLRVVLVGGRGAEQGHHGIADELLHRPPIALQVSPEPGVVGGEQAADVFDVEAFGAAGEADQVAEQHADPLALLPPGHRRSGQRGGTAQAESGPLGVVLTAVLADRHALDPKSRCWACPCILPVVLQPLDVEVRCTSRALRHRDRKGQAGHEQQVCSGMAAIVTGATVRRGPSPMANCLVGGLRRWRGSSLPAPRAVGPR
jgi:hypothetical protein